MLQFSYIKNLERKVHPNAWSLASLEGPDFSPLFIVKFIFSEKATKFCEILTFDWHYIGQKSSQNMNFKISIIVESPLCSG